MGKSELEKALDDAWSEYFSLWNESSAEANNYTVERTFDSMFDILREVIRRLDSNGIYDRS